MDNEIKEVQQKIRRVEDRIADVERQLNTSLPEKQKKRLWVEKRQLGEKENHLQKQKAMLMEKEMLLLRADMPEQPSKRPKTAPSAIQLFVQSAAASYTKWENDYRLARADARGDTEQMRRPFLEVKSDPFTNFRCGFLLWVRECYTDMKDILSAAKPGRRFTILGTSGIGKSLFTIFWICYRATLKEKVVWKQEEELFYLLDFSVESSAKAYVRRSLHDPDIQEVLDDGNAWLVIDGRQAGNLVCKCKVVQACSSRKENYHTYSKNQQVKVQYFSVWEEEEVRQFLDEFEQHRPKYKVMDVPVRDDALRYFQLIGGVARYVLCGRATGPRLEYVKFAVEELPKKTCVEYFAGKFEEGKKSDALVHIKCRQRTDGKYSGFSYDFASFDVRRQFRERFDDLSKFGVVRFLKQYANSTEAGSSYSYVFELVAHDLFKRGGEFRMKRVSQGGDAKGEEVAPLKVPNPMKVVLFDSLEKIPRLEADTYYQPRAENLKSIDAILHPDYLLQYFSYNSGVQGYMAKGLQEVDAALGLSKYKVCCCVPIDKYKKTGFQPWLTTGKNLYKAELPQMVKDSEQYVIGVDYNDFSS